MRAREYPGSDIVVEKVLDPGVNYNRYYVSYRSEGLKIYALMTVPTGEKPPTGWPVIIFNHGYIPPEVYVTTERYVAYVDLIARSGYIVFRSDYRGHGNSEGDANGAYSSPDYTVDVLNAVSSMKRYQDADPNRIGMWGHSMGGYITLRAMVISKDVKAGVVWGGVVASYPDLLTRWRRGPNASATPTPSPRSWRLSIIQKFGSPEENPEFWNSISANSYLGDISGPLQLHHGTADEEVPLEFSELLFYQMLNAAKYVELYKYEGDNHNISNNFSTAMQRSIEFFDKYVKQAQ
jgi:dipeptidyl aminopeptidase/acylaminoacyl peptidase